MADVIFVIVTVVFFIIACAVCPWLRSSLEEGAMGLEYLIGLIVSFLIMGYLIYALLWPEKF